ncbi:MAG TPA: hypothetical protein VEW46_06115 [Pyrinomonadaceae bacterium]|nr:hypothetical protein [Pyrinomonadaceae bacterium]
MTPSSQSQSSEKILFVSHNKKRCGVHEYGLSIAETLKKSRKYSFNYAECSGAEEFWAIAEAVSPSAVIYNHYPSTLPWLKAKVMRRLDVPHLGIMHEVTQQAADSADSRLFDYHIAPDPTLVLNNPIVFKTGRLIPEYVNEFSPPKVTTIGSFGFASGGKGFERLVAAVQEEFDEAIIRLHVPSGDYVSADVKDVARRCQKLIVKKGIRLVATHEFLEKRQLLDFLAQNTLNAFFYERLEGDTRGISSVIENALAVRRPIAITKSSMFRHILLGDDPPICIEPAKPWKHGLYLRLKRRLYLRTSNNQLSQKWLLKPESSLRQIIDKGVQPLLPFYQAWSEPNLIRDYENILDNVLGRRKAERRITV